MTEFPLIGYYEASIDLRPDGFVSVLNVVPVETTLFFKSQQIDPKCFKNVVNQSNDFVLVMDAAAVLKKRSKLRLLSEFPQT